jgi:uncharacterized protein YggL (DUF469 family)
MCVNLPTMGITLATEFWLNRQHNNNKELNQQIIHILNTIIKQNYFQYEGTYYQPRKGTAMGSPISGLIAEIYLQKIENHHIKHWLESKEIIFYKRYVDDILIAYNQRKTNDKTILQKNQ